MDTLVAKPKPLGLRIAVGVATTAIWVTTVLCHRLGGDIFAAYFRYATANWGPNGRVLSERVLFGTALGIGLLVLLLSSIRVLASPSGRRAVPELLWRFGAALLAAWATNRVFICIQSESIHYAQYGFVAFGFSFAFKNPRLGFLLGVFCGFLDEANQWWRMYFNECTEHLDWSDMSLNAAGAACGALPFTSLARLRRYEEGKDELVERGDPVLCLIAALAIGSLVLFLKTCCTLGHDILWPFWTQLDNHKPFHQMSLKEGIPGLLALSYVLYYVVDERRKNLPIHALVFALAAFHLGLTLPSERGAPVHENVPRAIVPKAKGPIAIDGKLDEKDWETALRVQLHSFAPDADEDDKKKAPFSFGPELATEARLLWDQNALYVAFQCETEDAWGRDLPRDHPAIASTPCVEVFLDPDAAEAAYYEFEVSAANRQADYFVYFPQLPQWAPWPTERDFVSLAGWDSKSFRSAVTVQGGELDLIGPDAALEPRKKEKTKGYTVEMAIPFSDMSGRAVSPDFHTGASPLKPGARFRANLYRVEAHRDGTPGTFMAWSPTHAPLDFHRPLYFSEITLGE